jgi:hypothetical protein
MATKRAVSAHALDKMVADWFFEIQAVADDMRIDPTFRPKVGNAYWHARDADGCNWNVRASTNLAGHSIAWKRIVNDLRRQYDIVE